MGVPAGSLPTPFINGFNGGYQIAYTVVLHLGGGDALYMITKRDLTVAPYSLTVKYGANTLTPLYDYYRPQYIAARVDGNPVDGIGDIDFGLNIDDGGGLSARAEARIQLLNMPLNGERLDWLLSMFDIENYDLEIWEGYIPLSGILQIDTDAILRFRGVVRDGAEYDHRTLMIKAYDRRDVDTILIPQYLVNEYTTPNPDEHYLGKPLPIVVGDFHTENVATQIVGSATIYAYEMLICHPAPTVRPSAAAIFYIADHAFPALSPSTNPVYFRTPDAKNWVVVIVSSGVVFADRFTSIRTPLGDTYIVPSLLGTHNTDSAFDSTDVDVINNDDASDYVVVAYPNILSLAFDTLNIPAEFVIAEDVSGGYGSSSDFVATIVTSSRTGNINLKIYDREDGTTTDKGVINTDRWAAGVDMPAGKATWNKLKQYDIEIVPQSGGSLRVHHLHCAVRCRPTMSYYEAVTRPKRVYGRPWWINNTPELVKTSHNDGITVSAKGCKYGTWITAGGRSVGHSIGDAIENPAYFVEFILRDYLGISASRVGTNAIDVLGNTTNGTRKNWNCKGSNREQIDGFEIIRQVCREHAMKHFYDHDSVAGTDVHRLIEIPDVNSTVAFTITASQIMCDGNGIPYVNVKKTPQSQLFNVIGAKYKYNHSIDDYSREIYIDDRDIDGNIESNFVDDTGSPRLNSYLAWVEGSITTYGRRVLRTFEFDYISDPTTAEMRVKKYLDWFAYQRMIVQMRVLKTLDTVGLRIGDVIKVDHALLNDLHQNSTPFIIDKIGYPPMGDTMEPYITIECQEIPNQYTGMRIIRGLAIRDSQIVVK